MNFVGRPTGKKQNGDEPGYHMNQMDNISKYKLEDLVKIPHRERAEEWIANNILGFHKQVGMLYGTVSCKCTRVTCPQMTAGNKYVFLLSDPITKKPVDLSASEYIQHSLDWIQSQLDDSNVFPKTAEQEFPSNFVDICKMICKLLLRVFAHIYHHHSSHVKDLREERHMNTNMKHFIFFVKEFRLLTQNDLEPLPMDLLKS